MSFVLLNVGFLTTLTMAVSAFIFCGGIVIVVAGIRMDKEALTRHADLAIPALSGTPAKSSKRGFASALFRETESGARSIEQRSAIQRVARFGVSGRLASVLFGAGRFLAAVGLGLIVMFVVGRIPAFADLPVVSAAAAVTTTIAGWFVPEAMIRLHLRKRARAVAAALPEAIDLMVICVDAGLSLEDALGRVVKGIRKAEPGLAEELELTSADLQVLPSRDAALQRMADRLDLPSVRAFVGTLIQTLRYGTPLAQSLRTISSEMRNEALIKLEEKANKLPALLTVPLIVLIMPTIFLIIGGPAFLRLMDIWR